MTEYEWATTRADAIQQFGGETPGAQLEQDIIRHFIDDPERVHRTITRIAGLPDIRSRWAVIRSELSRAAQADVTASNARGRTKQIDRAKQWIDNAGIHFDQQRHVEAELFGDEYGRGLIDNPDQQTRDELTTYWRDARPRGEQAERDFLAWNASCAAYHAARFAAARAKELQRRTTDDSKDEPADFEVNDGLEAEPAAVAAGPDDDINFDT